MITERKQPPVAQLIEHQAVMRVLEHVDVDGSEDARVWVVSATTFKKLSTCKVILPGPNRFQKQLKRRLDSTSYPQRELKLTVART